MRRDQRGEDVDIVGVVVVSADPRGRRTSVWSRITGLEVSFSVLLPSGLSLESMPGHD